MTQADLAPSQRAARPVPMGPRGRVAAGAVIATARDTSAALLRIGRGIAQDRRRLVAMLACTAFAVVCTALGPWMLGQATDHVVSAVRASHPVDFGALGVLLAIAAALQAAACLFQWWQGRLAAALVQGLARTLRRRCEEKLARLPLAWFDRQPHGEVLSRVTNDIDNVTQSLQQLLGHLLMSALSLLAVLAMMVLLAPPLAAVSLLGLGVSWFGARRIAAWSRPHFAAQWQWLGVLNGQVEENYSGQTLVKVFGHRDAARESFDAANEALAGEAMRAQALSGMVQPAIMFVGNLGFLAVVVVGGARVLAGSLSVGALQAFIQYVRQLNQPMTQLSSMVALVQSAAASAERTFELLDAPEMQPDGDAPAVLAEPRGHVLFREVGFRYLPDRPLLEHVDLEARPGQTVAIVGPTGAGKTTLVNLLMRFYEIDSGAILLDGIDIRSMAREELRRHFGMVLQDSWLFAGTVRDNIAYGRAVAGDEEILAAARACHVDDFVRALPQGYDTLLGEDGGGLSLGQRQLLTIARAFVAQPAVLILDEATSSVDTRTELLVQQAMARLRQGRTSFVIAHRLSTIRDADLIVYMEGGNVCEQGTHEQLMAARGRYWRLQQAQLADR